MNIYYKERIHTLLSSNLNPILVEKIAKEINSSFHNNLICCYASLTDVSDDDELDYYYRSCFNDINHKKDVQNHSYSVIKHNQGILIIYTTDSENAKDGLMGFFDRKGFDINTFVIGLSRTHNHLNNLGKAIQETIYAYASCAIDNIQFQDFDSIGLDKLLMPIRNEQRIKEYYNSFFEKITEYDTANNTDFFDTLIEFH